MKKAVVFTSHAASPATQPPESSLLSRLCHISSWQRLLKVIALCLRVKSRLASREVKWTTQTGCENIRPLPMVSVTLNELLEAEGEVLKIVQREQFREKIEVLKKLKKAGKATDRKLARERKLAIKKSSCLYRLDPFLDEDDIVRVGGRIRHSVRNS